MGVGKSFYGERVADALRMSFVDSDTAIEAKANKSVAAIFQEEGESAFRQYEYQFVEAHPDSGCVIACGGGLVLQTGLLQKLQERGVVIALLATSETLLARLKRESHKRPLLNVPNMKEHIYALLKEREPAYLNAGPSVTIDNKTPSQVVDEIINLFQNVQKPH